MHRRIRLHGKSRLDHLFECLHSELNDWLSQWSIDQDIIGLRPVSIEQPGIDSQLSWRCIKSKKGAIYVGLPRMFQEKLGGLLAKANDRAQLQLSSRVGTRAFDDLICKWTGTTSDDLVHESIASLPSDTNDAKFGFVSYELYGTRINAFIVVDAQLVSSKVTKGPVEIGSLDTIESAIRMEMVDLNVVLNMGSATVDDAIGLKIGDVFMSNISIDTAFQLSHPDSRKIASAHLVRIGDSRAIQLVSNN